ncbi:NAD-dependent epimerase/dehydratase family protein [Nocardioides albus]|uniref:Nucleoside-diphosphate-sugar epimerase n=1 Tax=Nocardioides albus TaxID=1841 RepID=A0A7W5A109_9ACTN|nr:NAD-dependent epimerase/dehydratase family protein [Nocardioides albus]MBB3087314.1 nucleoside-diphosphate-sugar epimerase [Nocardioides albus]GGU08096.1 NAD-dependent epimerase [Nocardioides albus]
MNSTYLVIGAGPVGATIAQQLADRGDRVRLLTRSGSGPVHASIERLHGDASDPETVTQAAAGVRAVFHCMHGSAYAAATWRAELPRAEQVVLEAAGRAGAVVVFPESLYAYGRVTGPMTEQTPRTADFGKPAVRVELLKARDASVTPTVSVAASDFYGPLVRTAHAGERMVPTVLAGRTMWVIGDPDAPHSWTYVPDLGAAMIRSADDESLWNTFLHAPTAPAISQRALVRTYAETAGVPAPRVAAIPGWAMKAIGTVHPGTRELAELAYQFDKPFVMDSTASEARLGMAPTPLETGAKATVDWWRTQA